MNPIIQKRYDKAGPRVAAALSRRNMEAFYCPTAIEGVQKSLLPGAVKADLKAFYQQHKM